MRIGVIAKETHSMISRETLIRLRKTCL